VSATQLDTTFAALTDPTRRAILQRLTSGPATVSELIEVSSLSQPAVSKHIKVLESANLVSRGRVAQTRPVRLNPKPLAKAASWLENYRQFWEGKFSELDALLEELPLGNGDS